MAKTKAKKLDPKKAVKKLLTAIQRGEADEAAIVGELGGLLDADPALIAEVDAQRLLPKSAEQGLLGVCELLLARGADPKARCDDDWIPGLASMIAASGDDARVIALAEQMVARGADVNERANDESALDRAVSESLARVEAILRLGADEACVIAALRPALSRRDPEQAAPIVARLLKHLASVDAPGGDGLSPLHIVGLLGGPALLEEVLARSRDPEHPVTAAYFFHCDGCSPPGGGIVPRVIIPRGATVLDAVTEVHAMYAAASSWYGAEGFDAKRRAARRDELAANRAALVARGVKHGALQPAEQDFTPEIDALLGRLAEHVGADVAALQRRGTSVLAEGVGPWTYVSTLLERSGGLLMRGVIEARRGDSWLAHLVAGDHRRFLADRQKRGVGEPIASDYPEAARRPIKTGLVVGGRDASLLIVWPHAPGVARVAVAAPGSFEVVGEDVLDFLRRELVALGVSIEGLSNGKVQGSDRGLVRVIVADYEHPPGPADISRLGGLPIGVDADTWPRHAGRPMHHVLTLDLQDHPTFGPKGVRALALFITSPSEHEAYAPRNRDARVLLLSEDDLRKGEAPWPDELADEERLPSGSLRFESAATLTEEELRARSFVGPIPLWLQDDESELFGDEDDDYAGEDDDYAGEDDDEGDDEADDPRPEAPRRFVLQFGEELVPGLNLGDMGIMYVFAETAWFQCH